MCISQVSLRWAASSRRPGLQSKPKPQIARVPLQEVGTELCWCQLPCLPAPPQHTWTRHHLASSVCGGPSCAVWQQRRGLQARRSHDVRRLNKVGSLKRPRTQQLECTQYVPHCARLCQNSVAGRGGEQAPASSRGCAGTLARRAWLAWLPGLA